MANLNETILYYYKLIWFMFSYENKQNISFE